jgi:type IV fimbrial biogenesis protein FimT
MTQKGFSLIELLAALALLGVLLHLGAGALGQLLISNRQQLMAQGLASGLRQARHEAILRHATTVIQAREDDWSQGWRIILDVSGRGPQDSDNPVLVEHQAGGQVVVVGNRPVKRFVRFSSLGQPLLPSGAFQAGTLHICAREQSTSRYQVVLSRTGRVSLRSEQTEQAVCADSD